MATPSKTASSSLRYSLAAIALNIVPILLLIVPLALTAQSTDSFLEAFAASLTPLKLGISLILGVAPSMFLGWRGIVLGQRANWYHNLRAVTDNAGASKAAFGQCFGLAGNLHGRGVGDFYGYRAVFVKRIYYKETKKQRHKGFSLFLCTFVMSFSTINIAPGANFSPWIWLLSFPINGRSPTPLPLTH